MHEDLVQRILSNAQLNTSTDQTGHLVHIWLTDLGFNYVKEERVSGEPPSHLNTSNPDGLDNCPVSELFAVNLFDSSLFTSLLVYNSLFYSSIGISVLWARI